MKPIGKQIVAEFIGCSSDLNNINFLKNILNSGIKRSGLHVKKLDFHKFDPIGVTMVAILSESHVALHTYPEAKHISLDVFTCSFDLKRPLKLMNFLKAKLKPKQVKMQELIRGEGLDVNQSNFILSPSKYGFEIKYQIKNKIFSKKTKYQQIDIIKNENFGRMFFLDGDLQCAEYDCHIYDQQLVEPLAGKSLNKVAILGGGDGGALAEILKHKPRQVILVDMDKDVVLAAKKFLNFKNKNIFKKSNIKIVFDDANKFLENNKNFEAIVYDLTMHPENIINITQSKFLNKIFAQIARSLKGEGIISMQCCSEFDNQTLKLLKKILPVYFTDIKFTKIFIPSYCEHWIFCSGQKI